MKFSPSFRKSRLQYDPPGQPSIFLNLEDRTPIYGLIFLYKWHEESIDEQKEKCPDNVWFANQVCDNQFRPSYLIADRRRP